MKDKLVITGIILAGGEGRRMGRKNKGLIPFHQKPLIQHVLQQLSPQLDHILISANEDIETYKNFGFPVISDQPEWQQKGPLSGILSVFPFIPKDTDAILVVPCDTPFLPTNLASTLQKSLYSKTEYDIAYAATSNQIHPSIFLHKPYINHDLPEHLRQQQYSLKSWIFKHQSIKTMFDDDHAFTNMNDMTTLNQNE